MVELLTVCHTQMGSVHDRGERRSDEGDWTDRRCSDPNSRVVRLRAPGMFPPAKSLLRTSGACACELVAVKPGESDERAERLPMMR